MSVWQDLPGQPEAVATLEQAVRNRGEGLHHAWLFTGPPGSGRSIAARSFAAALLCENEGCGTCQTCLLVKTNGHPDLTVMATDRVMIPIDDVRELVEMATYGSTMGGYRIILVEDADRMVSRTANVLLKALEEPPAGTIWLLCAPFEADLLPTIRSRVRKVGLKVPSTNDVAQLLVTRDKVDGQLAEIVAAESQSHIGMARRLATSPEARARRRDTLTAALEIDNISTAIATAERWLELAKKDADALNEERDSEERATFMANFGLDPESNLPPALRANLRRIEESQKRRATRSLRDGIDRILVDLLAVYRDILMLQLNGNRQLVNQDLEPAILKIAKSTPSSRTIEITDAIAEARERIESNVRDLLVLQSLAVRMIWKPL
ncbi:MAG: DNA polymerase III subunit delta' [Actinomycetes bacterium]